MIEALPAAPCPGPRPAERLWQRRLAPGRGAFLAVARCARSAAAREPAGTAGAAGRREAGERQRDRESVAFMIGYSFANAPRPCAAHPRPTALCRMPLPCCCAPHLDEHLLLSAASLRSALECLRACQSK